jgi:hypothetical protein
MSDINKRTILSRWILENFIEGFVKFMGIGEFTFDSRVRAFFKFNSNGQELGGKGI